MKVLIVHAHQEPKSFSSALARTALESLSSQGHEVDFVDLYGEKFDPVSDRRNFRSIKDPDYLKQQVEEAHATEVDGFAPELERDMRRLESCDLLIFSFPIWWFGMPAILKGWVDRVFAYVRVYGGEKLYEKGLGKGLKRGLVLMTTGGGPDVYSGYGVNPSLETVLAPVQHGVFWFNGILPLEPFVAWSPARVAPKARSGILAALQTRLQRIASEPTRVLPPLSDFPDWGRDTKKRFMVTVSRAKPVDERFLSLIPSEVAHLAEWKRTGVLLASHLSPPQADPWRGFLHFRETSSEAVQHHLDTLPLAPWLSFEITELG